MAGQVTDLGNGTVRLPSGTVINPQIYFTSAAQKQPGSYALPPGDYEALAQWTQANVPAQTYAGWVGSTTDYGGESLNSPKNAAQSAASAVQGTQQTNNAIFDNLEGWTRGAIGAENGQILDSQGRVQSAQDTANWLGGQNQQGIEQSWASTNAANAADQQTLGQYTSALQAANAWDLGNYGQLSGDMSNLNQFDMNNFSTLQNQAAGFQQLQAGGYGADVVSQAQYAQADPASIAAQNQALAQLQGAASGSLNVTSQAAQAYANDADIQNQARAADALQGIANGSKNVNTWELPGFEDLYAASQGSKDIHVGQDDPAAYAAEQSALQQFGDLTNPEVTAQEKFIYEQARDQQEQDERANREAVMTNLRQRGMSGSGAEIGNAALANQQTSENRLLSDLGAQANAVNRAMTALQGYGNLSGQMVNEADAVSSQNQTAQLNALSQMTGLGANVAEFNSNLDAQAQEAASNAYATLRAQGFSEEYARGQAADIVNSANSDRQLNAMNASGNLASNMRSESFNEDFSRKSAADQMAEFNKSQSLIQQRFQDQYAADQQNAAWGRDTDVATIGNQTAQQMSNNDMNRFVGANTVSTNFTNNAKGAFDAGTYVTNATNNRNQGSIGLASQLNTSTANAQLGVDQLGIQNDWSTSDTYAKQLAALTQLGMGRINSNTNTLGASLGVIKDAAGAQAAEAATEEAKREYDEDPGGLFGTGVLGKNGVLGVKGIPLI